MMAIWRSTGTVGGLVDDSDATVPVFDHGFTVGDGIFETMKVQQGLVFLWPWHLERLRVSARRMRMTLPSDDFLTDVVRGIARDSAGNVGSAARVRLTITAGIGPLGSNRLEVDPTIVCAASALPVRSGAARLHLASWPKNERSPLAGVKSTSYAENVLALAEATALGAGEALFLNSRGYVCEGTASNLFVVQDGVVSTPPPEAGLLEGVTRRFVLGLGDDAIRMHERNITRDELLAADEVFITSTFQDVRAVGAIDDRVFAAGPVTAALQGRFAAAALDPAHWS